MGQVINSKLIQPQGALDQLCGPYAITNALALCGVKSTALVFQSCVKALPQKRWPKVLWDGTTLDDLGRMINALGPTLRRHRIRITQPFAELEPRGDVDYWTRFDEQFADHSARVAILGLWKPLHHWIVAKPSGGRVQFIDSRPCDPAPLKNRKSLRIGQRNKDAKWLIDPGELILIKQEPRRGS